MTQKIDTIIIGGGVSGLSIAHKLRISCYGHRSVVLERSKSTGGVIRSFTENGYTAEIGPHGFLDNCHESRAIIEECSLHDECIKSPLIRFVRYVLIDGKLKMIPQTPLKIIFAPLIPWKDKLRVLGDLWKKPLPGEPSVEEWVQHRLGPALLPFADAVFTGTYAGDMARLTMDSVMPGARKLELEHGSLIRGIFAKIRNAKKSGGKKLSMPSMTSFPQGMRRLPEKLTEYLTPEKDLFLECGAERIAYSEGKWTVVTNRGEFMADNLVLAIPTNNALSLLKNLEEPPQMEVPEANIVTVVFGFGPGSILPPGFGYLIPEQESRFTLGTLFSSNMFPGRAPSGHILFETLIGGRRHPERLEMSDEELIQHALEDVRDVLPLQGDPLYTKVIRPWGPIPQLEKNYPALLQWRDGLTEKYQGLHICGFGWEGIGLNDMMKHATYVAEAIRTGSENNRQTEVKAVYF